MTTNSLLTIAWAWVQALAIDSSLGVTFSIVFQSLKERDWLKMSLYGVLTLVLVAAIITNIATSSHAFHISMTAAIAQIGLNVHLLIGSRSLAAASFMIIAPLKL